VEKDLRALLLAAALKQQIALGVSPWEKTR
jgi:hypothetical protein